MFLLVEYLLKHYSPSRYCLSSVTISHVYHPFAVSKVVNRRLAFKIAYSCWKKKVSEVSPQFVKMITMLIFLAIFQVADKSRCSTKQILTTVMKKWHKINLLIGLVNKVMMQGWNNVWMHFYLLSPILVHWYRNIIRFVDQTSAVS